MNDNVPKYVLLFLAVAYLLSGAAEAIVIKDGAEKVFESVRTLVPHVGMFILGFYYSKR